VAIGDRVEIIRTRTVLWAAGVQASPLGKLLSVRTAAETDRAGRVIVEPDLSVRGHPEILVIGDLANYSHQTGSPLPGVAPVAMQQGRYVAQLIRARVKGRTLPPFRYRDKGSLATIGRAEAVADFGRLRFSGLTAWLVWLFVHLMYLVEFQNRVLVLIEWTYNYLTRNRGARLITGAEAGERDQRSREAQRA
jgi:NADH dehydrogenase